MQTPRKQGYFDKHPAHNDYGVVFKYKKQSTFDNKRRLPLSDASVLANVPEEENTPKVGTEEPASGE